MIVTTWVKYTSTTEQTGLVFPRSQHPRREEIHRFRLAATTPNCLGEGTPLEVQEGKMQVKRAAVWGKHWKTSV